MKVEEQFYRSPKFTEHNLEDFLRELHEIKGEMEEWGAERIVISSYRQKFIIKATKTPKLFKKLQGLSSPINGLVYKSDVEKMIEDYLEEKKPIDKR